MQFDKDTKPFQWIKINENRMAKAISLNLLMIFLFAVFFSFLSHCIS